MAGRRRAYDLIVSNPPYVARSDPHLAALRHEPLQALAAGDDGLDDLRAIVAAAPAHLAAGGWLLLEHGWDQAAAVRALLRGAGLTGCTPGRPGRHRPLLRRAPAGAAIIAIRFDGQRGHGPRRTPMSDPQQRIDQLVKDSDVLLFMKGSASFPMCGFSGRAIQILKACGVDPNTEDRQRAGRRRDPPGHQGIQQLADHPAAVRARANSSAARTS